jgi:hypothetical protein
MTPAATPEPAALTLFAIAGLGLAGYSWGVTPRDQVSHAVTWWRYEPDQRGVAMGPRGAIPLNLALMDAELFDQQHEECRGQ